MLHETRIRAAASTSLFLATAFLVGATALSGCRRAPNAPPDDAAANEPALGVSHGDTRIFARAVGGAAPLVVINGGPGASHHAVLGLEALASPSLRVVLYDQRGMGASAPPLDMKRFTLDDYVADIESLRRGLGAEKLHVLGHSFGGLVAMAYAAAHAERVASLVLVSPRAPEWPAHQASMTAFEAHVAALVGTKAIPADPPPANGDDCRAQSNSFLPALFADPSFPIPTLETAKTACSTRVREATEELLVGYDLRPRLGVFRAPTLIVVGEGDPFGEAPAQASRRALQMARPEYALLPKCGHFPWIECAGAFRSRVEEFLAREAHR